MKLGLYLSILALSFGIGCSTPPVAKQIPQSNFNKNGMEYAIVKSIMTQQYSFLNPNNIRSVGTYQISDAAIMLLRITTGFESGSIKVEVSDGGVQVGGKVPEISNHMLEQLVKEADWDKNKKVTLDECTALACDAITTVISMNR